MCKQVDVIADCTKNRPIFIKVEMWADTFMEYKFMLGESVRNKFM